MTEWKKTSCVLCAQNCGLEVKTDVNRITAVRPDKNNPRSEGYVCRKGQNVAYFQNHKQRLAHPLKKVGDSFEKITWDQAVDEIAEKLKKILDKHGPRSIAYMGGGGQGCHFEAAFGRSFLTALGSQYHYNAVAQELTGMFWVHGRTFGKQYLHILPDEHNTDMLVAVGWNGWMSHQMAQARRQLKRIADDPDKLLVVIDPRRCETAERADIHLQIRPGTDALFTRAAIAIILEEGWHDQKYIDKHVSGFDEITHLFKGFDTRAAIKVCGLDYDQVREFVKLFTTSKSSMHADLGILMNRHSTAASYLGIVLLAVCGRIGVEGGNIFPGTIMPLGSHSDERKDKTWRTRATDFPAIMGYFPPNVMPEEIMSDHEDRLRAVIVSGSNPLRSYADTTAYEKAFAELDLLVTIEIAMSETAVLSHYVLPALSAYEKWDSSFFAWNFPEIYFQLRRPVVEPCGECLEEGEIFTRLAERMDIIPDIPDSLKEEAKDRSKFAAALMGFVTKNPESMKVVPMVLARTLGPVVGSGNLAALWGLLQTAPPAFRENAVRAGFESGPAMGEQIFKVLIDNPQGIWIGKSDPEQNLQSLQTKNGKIDLLIPELLEWVESVDAASEEEILARRDEEYPLILMAGRHIDTNANTLMRDPAWNKGRRACTLAMHPEDADALGIEDGQMVRVTTEAGSEEVELEVTDSAHPGHVVIPHGFGLVYEGSAYGANVNRLTKNTNRDPLAATPLHRYVPCKVTAA